MIVLSEIEDYWEFYEFETEKNRVNEIINIINNVSNKCIELVSKMNVPVNMEKGYFYISPHAVIRLMQSDISTRIIANSLDFALKTHLITLHSKSVPYNTFQGNLKVLPAALNRVELKNKFIFVVLKTREEDFYLNRLDIISVGKPNERPRNSKKPDNWNSLSNDQKKEYLKNKIKK